MKKTPLLLALSLVAPAAAQAFETTDTFRWPRDFPAYADTAPPARPTDIFFRAGIMEDSNVLRLETGGTSDRIMRFGAGIAHTQRIVGRQSVRLEAAGDYYKYDRFSAIDHFAYGLRGEWLWEVGNQLSGTLGATRVRRQADLSELQRAVRDMITDSRYYGTAGYLITPSFRVRGGLDHTRGERDLRAEAELRRTSVTAGADYVSPLGNTLGAEVRRTTGDAPVPEFVAPTGTFINNDFRETEASIVGAYALGTTLRTSLRFGRTNREYSQLPGRDFSGTSGRATVDWLPAPRTLLSASVYREPRSVLDIAATHVTTSGITFGAAWATTAKVVLSARFARESRDATGDVTAVLVPGTALREETVRVWRFGLGWEPQRHWEIGFGFDMGERDSNIVGRDYKYNAFMANVAYRY
ncbi:MAG TPA: hypothetical protein VD965_10745 [Burkholderiales bacterium]|nr:hypothetical protein [Burkholderiales bacterium]